MRKLLHIPSGKYVIQVIGLNTQDVLKNSYWIDGSDPRLNSLTHAITYNLKVKTITKKLLRQISYDVKYTVQKSELAWMESDDDEI